MFRYAITDRTLFPQNPGVHNALSHPSSAPSHQALIAHCAALAQNGIDYLLIREKDLSAGALAQLSRQILAAVNQANPHTRVLIASRPDIALATLLDGVQLSAHPAELTPIQIRTLYARAACPAPILSISCHTLAEVRSAHENGVSLILFAPIFGKTVSGSEVTPPAGLEVLRQACTLAAPIPVLALGGVTAQNTPSCLDSGAAGIASIRLFMRPHLPQ